MSLYLTAPMVKERTRQGEIVQELCVGKNSGLWGGLEMLGQCPWSNRLFESNSSACWWSETKEDYGKTLGRGHRAANPIAMGYTWWQQTSAVRRSQRCKGHCVAVGTEKYMLVPKATWCLSWGMCHRLWEEECWADPECKTAQFTIFRVKKRLPHSKLHQRLGCCKISGRCCCDLTMESLKTPWEIWKFQVYSFQI